MASQLKVDTITGVTTAGSIAVTGEGSSTTTNLQQGLAKAWVNFNGEGTAAIRDSFNVSALGDSGTGNYFYNTTNNLATANYARLVSAGDSGNRRVADTGAAASNTTSALIVITEDFAGSLADVDDANGMAKGDLA